MRLNKNQTKILQAGLLRGDLFPKLEDTYVIEDVVDHDLKKLVEQFKFNKSKEELEEEGRRKRERDIMKERRRGNFKK